MTQDRGREVVACLKFGGFGNWVDILVVSMERWMSQVIKGTLGGCTMDETLGGLDEKVDESNY